ncbi:MAG: hypothetical protein GC206_00300 [Alphaproteobacteria bacterium]|nr:hypothetical protein [Alphaproteobacteria bacterium]
MSVVAPAMALEWAGVAMLLAPLLGACLSLFLGGRGGGAAAIVCALIATAAAFYLTPGARSLTLMGLAVDPVAASVAPVMAASGAACIIMARVLCDEGRGPAPLMLALLQLSWFGWMAATLSQSLAAVFVHVQIAWLAICAAAALGGSRDRAALVGALRQALAGGIAGAGFVLGAALAHQAAGGDAFEALREARPGPARAAGYALMIAACALWAGAAPLNAWMVHIADRGARAAAMVCGALAPLAMLTVLARLAASADDALGAALTPAFAALGAIGIVVGTAQALGAQDLRRLSAYVHAVQFGAALIALSLATVVGRAAALTQASHLAIVGLGLLAGAAIFQGRASLDALDGLGRRAPVSAAAIAVAALSLIGAPLTFGFLARWRLIEASLGSGWWWAGALIIAAALAAVFYAGRLLERLYARAPGEAALAPMRTSRTLVQCAGMAALVSLGVNAGPLWGTATAAARALGAAP